MISNLTRYLSGSNLKVCCARSSIILTIGTVIEKGLVFCRKMISIRLLAFQIAIDSE